jgi:hypothetical protein
MTGGAYARAGGTTRSTSASVLIAPPGNARRVTVLIGLLARATVRFCADSLTLFSL